MKTTIVWGLLVLNALLLGTFLSHYLHEDTAQAQVPTAVAGPGEYILCPGAITGIGSEVVYVIDTLNGQMGAVVYDVNGSRLDTMAGVDLNRVYQTAALPQAAPGQTVPPANRR
jgi:hypothetical protein